MYPSRLEFGLSGVAFAGWCPSFGGSGGKRSTVEGFSSASARRLRRFLFEHSAPLPVWAITLTRRDSVTPDRWRRDVDVFSKRVRRLGDCGVWRVELQRRGVPHLHCVAWSSDPQLWRSAWLDVIGQSRDRDHLLHAVDIRPCDSGVWFSYVAAHASKHKSSQLGWAGRQWGVFNRGAFVRSHIDSYDLPAHVAWRAVRLFGVLLWFRGLRAHSLSNNFVRFLPPEDIALFRRCVSRALDREAGF